MPPCSVAIRFRRIFRRRERDLLIADVETAIAKQLGKCGAGACMFVRNGEYAVVFLLLSDPEHADRAEKALARCVATGDVGGIAAYPASGKKPTPRLLRNLVIGGIYAVLKTTGPSFKDARRLAQATVARKPLYLREWATALAKAVAEQKQEEEGMVTILVYAGHAALAHRDMNLDATLKLE